MANTDRLDAQGGSTDTGGDAPDGEARSRKALVDDPGNALALRQLSAIEGEKGNHGEAVPLIRRALWIEPRQPVWWLESAKTLVAAGRGDEARWHYERALIMNASNLVEGGQLEEAKFSYEKALEFNPNNSAATSALALLNGTVLSESQDSDPFRALDNLANDLFRIGDLVASALVRRVLRQVMDYDVAVLNTDLKLCRVKPAQQWSADNGYQRTSATLNVALHRDPKLTESFPFWRDALANFLTVESSNFDIIRGNKVIVSAFGWPNLQPAAGHQQFDILSQTYDLLVEMPYWLKNMEGKAIYRALSRDGSRMLIDFRDGRSRTITDKCIMIGGTGQQNWGHWLMDFVVKLAALEHIPGGEEAKLVFGPLRGHQRDCLRILGIDLSRIIELELNPGKPTRYQFDDLTCISGMPWHSAAALRKWFARSVPARPAAPEFVYFSRRNEFPRHRISNIDEVEALLKAKGFFIIDNQRDLSTADLVATLGNARVIVLPSGAETGNLALCNEDTVIVGLLSELVIIGSYDTNMVGNVYIPTYFGSGLSTVFVYGKPANPEDTSFDGICAYNLDLLDRAIELAAGFSRHREPRTLAGVETTTLSPQYAYFREN